MTYKKSTLYKILNRQGYKIGEALVMGDYSYYLIYDKSFIRFTEEINTDELFSKYNLQLE